MDSDLSYDECLEDKREDYQNCLCCIMYHSCTQLYAHNSSYRVN